MSAARPAILGTSPEFDEVLHVGRPNLGDRAALLSRLNDVLDRRWLSNVGRYVQELEARIAAACGVKHAIAVSNATVGLELLIEALDIKGEVIVPSFTFIATAHAVQWRGATPVFADVDPATHCLDPSSAATALSPRTSAIMGVHLWGNACDVAALERLAASRGIPLLFDASHAFGCEGPGRMIGGFGRAEVFSFHATKFVNCLEGGAITTDDDALAGKLRLMKNFGFSGYDNVVALGTNAKMDEFSAAMGLTNLEAMDRFITINKRNHAAYRNNLAALPGITLMDHPSDRRHNFQYVVADVDETVFPLTRDELLEVLWADNIRARRYFWPSCHNMAPYQGNPVHTPVPLPATERVARGILVLPTGETLEEPGVARICACIAGAARHAADIRRHLAKTTAPSA